MATVELQALALGIGIILFATHFMVKNKLIKGIILLLTAAGIMLSQASLAQGTIIMLVPAQAILVLVAFYNLMQGITGRGIETGRVV